MLEQIDRELLINLIKKADTQDFIFILQFLKNKINESEKETINDIKVVISDLMAKAV